MTNFSVDLCSLIVEVNTEINLKNNKEIISIFEKNNSVELEYSINEKIINGEPQYEVCIWFDIIKNNEYPKEIKKIISEIEKEINRLEKEYEEKIKMEKDKLENNIKWIIDNKIVKAKKSLEIIY